ncbi:hypothetical protein A4X13_0g2052 [Tilletia indica]|uniref:Uncharacterized protein n=1 Tax=Tilletia indica TaxID=43049 RepID=A0A177TGY9_9BASI|nr:hypothetical protein A4X13_0g2052 [Tilletia indica]
MQLNPELVYMYDTYLAAAGILFSELRLSGEYIASGLRPQALRRSGIRPRFLLSLLIYGLESRPMSQIPTTFDGLKCSIPSLAPASALLFYCPKG